MINKIINEDDIIVLGNFNDYSHKIIQQEIKDSRCKIMGGWNLQSDSNANITIEKFLLAESVNDMKKKLTHEKPNTAIIFLKSAMLNDIRELVEIENIRKVIEDISDLVKIESIRKVIFIAGIIDRITVKKIYKALHQSAVTPYFITGFHAAYLGSNPDFIIWNYLEIDPDLDEELRKENISSGKFLDVGTGSGSQAIALYRKGFDVTAIDLVPYAYTQAQLVEPGIRFLEDNILNSQLNDTFNYVFDRGCFHSISPSDRMAYFNQIHKLIKKNGFLFIKCRGKNNLSDHFYNDNPMPYRFSEDMFVPDIFKVKRIKQTEYQSTNCDSPFKALFFVLEKI